MREEEVRTEASSPRSRAPDCAKGGSAGLHPARRPVSRSRPGCSGRDRQRTDRGAEPSQNAAVGEREIRPQPRGHPIQRAGRRTAGALTAGSPRRRCEAPSAITSGHGRGASRSRSEPLRQRPRAGQGGGCRRFFRPADQELDRQVVAGGRPSARRPAARSTTRRPPDRHAAEDQPPRARTTGRPARPAEPAPSTAAHCRADDRDPPNKAKAEHGAGYERAAARAWDLAASVGIRSFTGRMLSDSRPRTRERGPSAFQIAAGVQMGLEALSGNVAGPLHAVVGSRRRARGGAAQIVSGPVASRDPRRRALARTRPSSRSRARFAPATQAGEEARSSATAPGFSAAVSSRRARSSSSAGRKRGSSGRPRRSSLPAKRSITSGREGFGIGEA